MNTFPTLVRNLALASVDISPAVDPEVRKTLGDQTPFQAATVTMVPLVRSGEFRTVTGSNVNTVQAFYEANKGQPFYWHDALAAVWREVVFNAPPSYKPQPDVPGYWKITVSFKEWSKTTYTTQPT